ncbi:MAG: VOC family protein [Actinomycetia bacterium]|nr:VOC family protein [Actinomycetes bacterium]
MHGVQGEGHVAFMMRESDTDAWRTHLNSHGVPIESEVSWPDGGHSIYVRDPGGNSVEFTTPALWRLPETRNT